jgi:hypothetical protein
MPNPFPGMNPYLEQPEFWSDFHNHLVIALAKALIPKLLPKYRVVTDKWIYKVAGSTAMAIGRPDLAMQQAKRQSALPTKTALLNVQPIPVTLPMPQEIQQSYLEVKDVATQEVISTLEILSPANKRGEGQKKYEAKRQLVLDSLTHLVEIDLLRDGSPLPFETDAESSHYRILVSRSQTRPVADLYPFNLGDRIPDFPLPLRPEDHEPIVNLQQIVTDLYAQLGYDYFINYDHAPPPPWTPDEVASVLHPDRNTSL